MYCNSTLIRSISLSRNVSMWEKSGKGKMFHVHHLLAIHKPPLKYHHLCVCQHRDWGSSNTFSRLYIPQGSQLTWVFSKININYCWYSSNGLFHIRCVYCYECVSSTRIPRFISRYNRFWYSGSLGVVDNTMDILLSNGISPYFSFINRHIWLLCNAPHSYTR